MFGTTLEITTFHHAGNLTDQTYTRADDRGIILPLASAPKLPPVVGGERL